MAKHSRHPYEMLHIDFKYIGVRSWGGAIGESTIVDDFSRDIHVIPLHSKRHFLDKFKTCMSHNVTSRGYKTSVIRCDNGTEMKNYKFLDFLTFMNARAEFTSAYSPDSDGVVERAHQTVLTIVNTLRVASNLLIAWGMGRAGVDSVFPASYLTMQ